MKYVVKYDIVIYSMHDVTAFLFVFQKSVSGFPYSLLLLDCIVAKSIKKLYNVYCMLVHESWGGTSMPMTIMTATEAQSLFRVYALCTKSMCQFWYESLVFPTSTNTMSIDFLCLRSTPGPRQTRLEERWRRTDFIISLESKRWNGGQPTALCPNESACKYCRGCLAPKRWVALVRWIDDCWEWAEIGIHFLCHLGSRPDCRERFHVAEAGVTVHVKNVT